MKLDPVLAEVRRVREEYALKFNGDIKAMMDDIRQRQVASGRKTVSLEPKRVKPSPTCQ
jgi:hypothetical protein